MNDLIDARESGRYETGVLGTDDHGFLGEIHSILKLKVKAALTLQVLRCQLRVVSHSMIYCRT